MILRWAVLAWSAWCILQTGPQFAAWGGLWRSLSGITFSGVLSIKTPFAFLRHALLLLAGIVISAGFASAGSRVLRLLPRMTMSAWERLAIGVLLGFAALGTWLFGLALVGLYFTPVVFISFAVALVLPAAWRELTNLRIGSWRTGGTAGSVWLALAAAPALVAFTAMLLPDTNSDAYILHLSLTEQVLRVHRFSTENMSEAYQFPLLAEFTYSLAVASGHDAVAHLIQFVAFLAATILLVGWSTRQAGRLAGVITAVLVATCGSSFHMMIVARNDLSAAAFPVAGIVCAARGLFTPSRPWLVVGAVLLGCGSAVKYNDVALLGMFWAACALAMKRFGRRTAGYVLLLIALPIIPFAPWGIKTWLMTGNPVWPLMSGLFPGALMDRESGELIRILRGEARSWRVLVDYPGALVSSMIATHLAAACSMPACVVLLVKYRTETGFVIAYSLVGIFIMWIAMPSAGMRYALPVFLMMLACAGVVCARKSLECSRTVRLAVMIVGISAGWLPLGSLLTAGLDSVLALKYLSGSIDVDGYLGRRLGTYWQVGKTMRSVPGLRRFVGGGAGRCFHLPGRCIQERFIYRSHAWVFARECRTADEIRVKFRQAGCGHVLYNFFGDSMPTIGASAFPWNERMLLVWKDFVGRYMDLVAPPATVDFRNGGYCLYHIRRIPRSRPPVYLPYMPGIVGLYHDVTRHEGEDDGRGWLEAALELDRKVPGVDFIKDLVARGYEKTGRYDLAYKYYGIGVSHGTVGVNNFWRMAQNAIKMEKYDEAISLLGLGARFFPDTRGIAFMSAQKVRNILAMRRSGYKVRAETLDLEEYRAKLTK